MDPSRVSLRPFNLSDAEDFLKWASDDRVTQYLRWNSMTTKEEALAYIQNVAIPHPWRRSICLDGRSIGYAVGVEYWGQGVATEALRMAILMAFKELRVVVRIEALVDVENKGSQRVLGKLGFTKEGLLRKYGFCKGEIRDFLIYSFLATDKLL